MTAGSPQKHGGLTLVPHAQTVTFHDDRPDAVVIFGGRPFTRVDGVWALIDDVDIRGWAPEDC